MTVGAVEILTVLGVIVAAAAGAALRHLVSDQLNGQFPYGTMVVNISTAGALGLLSQTDGPWRTVAGIGALGAMSTWSAVANEVAVLARSGEGTIAALYLGATLTTSVLAAWAGMQLLPG